MAEETKENSAAKSSSKLKKNEGKVNAKSKQKGYKNVPTALTQKHIDDLDEIGKAEEMTRSELIRRAVEHFVVCYNADKLDERQSVLLKQMKAMESALRALLVKSIRLNGQVLYFETLPYTMGTPKQKLNDAGFKALYEKSANFAGEFLKSKTAGKVLSELSDEGSAEAKDQGESE